MNKLIFTILLSLCTMQGWAKAQCDTLGIDQSTIKEIVTESYVNTKGAKATKTYAVVYYNGSKHLCTISKTVLSKVTLCNKYGCRLALGLVRKNKVPARVVLL
jgi:hypothetical protein